VVGRIDADVAHHPLDHRTLGIVEHAVGGGDETQILDDANQALWEVVEHGIYFVGCPTDAVAQGAGTVATNPSSTVVYYEFATGRREELVELAEVLDFGFAVPPDERWFLYQRSEDEYDIMLVEGFR